MLIYKTTTQCYRRIQYRDPAWPESGQFYRVDKDNVNLRLSGLDKSDVTELEGKSPMP